MIVVINYGDNSTRLVAEALKKLNVDFIVSESEASITRADKIILPGEGDAPDAIKQLHILNLFSILKIIKKPILGIGLGMQLMANYTKDRSITCLGIFPGSAEEFKKPDSTIPNEKESGIKIIKPGKLLNGVELSDKFYFKHRFYLPLNEFTTSVSTNGVEFSATIEKDNCYGMQFHPECSGDSGLKVLKNFVRLV
jgi:imidazole glycerol-phosphate synthase subunit HisH